MRLISLSLAVSLIALVGCKGDRTGEACDSLAPDEFNEMCDDGIDCTEDWCEENDRCVNEYVPGPECPMMCDDVAACEDSDPCTTDSCAEGSCANTPIADCGGCTIDADCDDGDGCTDDVCGVDSLCGYTPVDSVACGACENDDVCDASESCFCADCTEDARCASPADCIEVLAPDLTKFGEGPVTDADGNDLEGAGNDIMQVFDYMDAPEGVFDFTQIADHDECFAAGSGCAQLRINMGTATPIEAMFTSGSWLRNADNSGDIASATAYEYTQGAGGVMDYVVDGRCYWIEFAHYEP